MSETSRPSGRGVFYVEITDHIELTSERLRSRAFSDEDFPVIYDMLSDRENMKYRSSERYTQRRMASSQQITDNHTPVYLRVIYTGVIF